MARVVYNKFESVIWVITLNIMFHYVLEDPFVSLASRRELIFIKHCLSLASFTSDCLFVIKFIVEAGVQDATTHTLFHVLPASTAFILLSTSFG